MTDFLTALALVLVIEGLFLAVFPQRVRQILEVLETIPPETQEWCKPAINSPTSYRSLQVVHFLLRGSKNPAPVVPNSQATALWPGRRWCPGIRRDETVSRGSSAPGPNRSNPPSEGED